MKTFTLITFLLLSLVTQAQVPFYYTFKKVKGTIYQSDSAAVEVKFKSRKKLVIKNCSQPAPDSFLRVLTLSRQSRYALENLLSSSAQYTIEILPSAGIGIDKGKYRLMAGMTGPENDSSIVLICDSTIRKARKYKRKETEMVWSKNKIQIFKGSLEYILDSTHSLKPGKVVLYDFSTRKYIPEFKSDTIRPEPFMHPEMLYQNTMELYYFAGIHEIFHTNPANIYLQRHKLNAEPDAYAQETKAFKKRKKINRAKLRF